MAISFNSAIIARVAAALYDVQLGNETMDWALEQVNVAGGDVGAVVQSVYNVDFAGKTYAQVATTIVKNVGLTGAIVPAAEQAVVDALNAGGAGHEGQSIVNILNIFSTLTNHADASLAAAATAFNAQITAAVNYANSNNTPDVPVHPPSNLVFTVTAETAAGADVMHLTGNQDVRIDFTNPANQVTGLDLDGDGTIEFNGSERSVTGIAANFEIVDAYSRNPLNHQDTANNFLGDIWFDGEGFVGDGVSTNGNIFLGGLGHDTALSGDGNDFLAGGGIAQGHGGSDTLYGGRNADFFFAQFAGIDLTDGGTTLRIDGGNTADDTAAGTAQSPQDADWLLFEASDDQEPVVINLGEDTTPFVDATEVASRTGETMDVEDVENFDASGNLYGFLDDMDVQIGDRAIDDRDADNATVGYNYGYGSTAQLNITGSAVANIIIAGYDNDSVNGAAGNDLLMGGNLNFLNNPNSVGIWNNGRDTLVGGAGDDNIVFETDGGIYEGGAAQDANDGGDDTLWLTKDAFGTRTVSDVTSDGTVRLDLAVGRLGGLDNAAGYGGADKNYSDGSFTSDQTNYKAGYTRGQVQDFASVIATGLGGVDYLAAGTNDPELVFTNQQNHFAFLGNLDLRGTDGSNTLYAVGGTDILEGRDGDDALSGGDGNDDFYFGTANAGSNIGDAVDVIHRQTDANGDNLWDTDADGNGLYERDFNIGGTSTTGPSKLIVDLGTTDLASPDVALTSFTIKIGGTTFSVTDSAALIAATSAAAVAALVNTAYQAIDTKVSAVAVGNTIVVTDTGGRDISDTVAEGYAVGGVVSNGAFSALATYQAPGTQTTKDRLIYKSYEDRQDNEGTNDDATLGSNISLGTDAYAEDLVINFADEDGDGVATTRLAEDQAYDLTFTNLTTEDRVTIEVNGVKYSLQVGVDLDGNVIADEDGVGDTQADIQAAFLTRLTAFINSFMDDDTSAGKVSAALAGSTITLTQADYNGEETVFMTTPVVTLGNQSGGEPAKVSIANVSEHEVELLDFDGRNGELNETNVLFWGQEAENRAELSTALNAGGTQTGYEAIVVDVGANNLQDVVFGTTTAIPNNTATNSPLSVIPNGVAVHGDDFLLGGNGLDTINGGTGDDRVEGSIGGNGTTTWDTLDGGKNFYAVQVLGEAQARVYILNKWEAANPAKVAALTGIGTITAITLINQTENGTGTISGVFDDTLQFSQKLFTPGVTRFTVTLDNFTLTGGVVELRNDGAGTVGVDVDGNGTIDNWTRFTNFENIRTVSGVGNAVAGDGQGNDTLNVTALSSATTGANGILYNLTNDALGAAGGDPGSVMYSANAHASLTRPAATDFESLVIKVDGVESVIGGTGDDLLLIDETEAAKNNTFTGDLGDDRIEYQNAFSGEATPGAAEPTVTIKVDTVAASLGGTDTVTMTGGRVGTTIATDTLNGVEFITLAGRTAAGTREDDVLDVTAMVAGAIVSYVDGTVRALDSSLHLTVEGIDEIENIWADGNDTVIVADATVMGGNQRSDVGTAAGTNDVDIALASFIDFDTLKNAGTDNTRKAFISQTTAEIEDVINQNQFKFNLSKTGAGADSDTVDYSNAVDNISVLVELDPTKPNQFVIVDSDGATFYDAVGDIEEAGDRVDQLISVERIVAAQGESVLDLTASTKGLEIKFNSAQLADRVAATATTNAYDVSSVRISDLSTASPLSRSFIEYRDASDVDVAGLANKPTATWSRIEGSDNAEVVIMNSAHSFDVTNTFNLRGGANQMKYNELTRSITTTLSVVDFVAATPLTTGLITAVTTFQDGNGAALTGGGTHTATSYTANNGIAAGSLRIAASQDAEDTLAISGISSKTFILAEQGTTDNQITVKLGSGAAQNSVILTGYEFLADATSDDIYDMGNLSSALQGLTLTDNDDDHDGIKVGNDAVGFNASGANTIDLDNLSSNAGGFNFDFDVLDITKVTNTALILNGGTDAAPLETDADETADNTDEVVLGALAKVTSINDFESMVLTQDSVAAGTSFTFNPGANTLVQGSTTVSTSADALSFGGLLFENTLRNGTIADVTTGVTVQVAGSTAATVRGGDGNDTITGGGGADFLAGNGGNDTLDGGTAAEVRTVQLDGISDADAGDSVTLTFDADGAGAGTYAVTVTAGVEYAAGAGSAAIGAALAAKITTELAALNAGVSAADAAWNNGASLLSATFSNSTGLLTFTFSSGVDVTGTIATATTEAGTFAISTETVVTEGSDGGVDTFVFEETATNNGQDTINNFVAVDGASDDLLDFTAFLGAAAVTGGAAVNGAAADLDLTVNNVGVMFGKGTLANGDVKLLANATGANGEVFLVNNGKGVVLVSADADGTSDATNDSYKVYFVQDTDAGAGQTFTATLVGTINSAVELDAVDLFGAADAFV